MIEKKEHFRSFFLQFKVTEERGSNGAENEDFLFFGLCFIPFKRDKAHSLDFEKSSGKTRFR